MLLNAHIRRGAERARRLTTPWLGAALLASCEGYLDLNEARQVEEPPTLEAAVGSVCSEYCDAVLANCTGSTQVYINRTQCLGLCGVMAEGQLGEDRGDTAHCRLTHAIAARDTGEPASHCPQAGPGGAAGVADAPSCATNCEGLCSAMLGVCPEQYASLNACLDECSGVPNLGGYNTGIGQGNSVQCRLFHLVAAAAAPEPHCTHAAGATPCR